MRRGGRAARGGLSAVAVLALLVSAGGHAEAVSGPITAQEPPLPAAGLVGVAGQPMVGVTALGEPDVVPSAQLARLARVGGGPVHRLAGPDRYATAVAVSQGLAPAGSAEVVLASGATFADALSAGPLAARLSGVLLLTTPARLPDAVRAELVRLKPRRITVVGGTGAVSAAVVTAARTSAGGSAVAVRRLAGDDRYLTARRVSAEWPAGSGGAVLASGVDFPDGVSAVPVAAVLKGPVLLTQPTTLDPAVRGELTRLAPSRLVVAGGTAAVSVAVETAAERAAGRAAQRAAGPDRYATSAALARVVAGAHAPSRVFVATGTDFPDALVGGVAAARSSSPLLLTSTRRGGGSTAAAEVGRLRGFQPWLQMALDMLARQQTLRDPDHAAYDAAYQAGTLAGLFGWADPEVQAQLRRLRAERKPDGGYGLEVAWDAFGDGTVNPATTSYLATVTDHVGRVLLAGHAAGAVGDAEVTALVDRVLSWPRLRGDSRCLSYSAAPADNRHCVYNVNSSAAWFLRAAHSAGVRRPGQLELADSLYSHDAALQDGAWWPYSSSRPGTRQDWNHNAAMVDFQLLADPARGRASLDTLMASGWIHPDSEERRYDDAMGYVRLLPFDCARRARALDAARKVAAQQRISSDTGQLALWSVRIAAACEA